MHDHIVMPLDFRLSAWPKGGDNYVTTYNTDRYLIDLKMVLDYVEESLKGTPMAFIFKTSFTLVNLYTMYTDHSVGLCDSPPKNVMRTGLVFTFARTIRQYDNTQKAVHSTWMRGYTCIWGTSDNQSADYISISIPLNILTRARMQQMMDRDQRLFYEIAGGYTKAIIRQQIDFSGGVDTTAAKLLYQNIPRAMFYTSMNDWKYVLDFWKRMPDLLHVDWSPKFIEYYVRFIAPNLPMRQRSKYYALYREQAQDQLREFLLRYVQNQIEPEEAGLAALLPLEENALHDIETLVSQLSQGVVQ
uniref:Virion structural protein n=1 Tax=Pseudomonas phage HRDY3 TaxID=3236930 RepID=A0AB39CEG2_9VIRU